MTYNRAALLELVKGLTENEFSDFVFGYFAEVHDTFTPGMDAGQKRRDLVGFAIHHSQEEVIIDYVRQKSHEHYAKVAPRLRHEEQSGRQVQDNLRESAQRLENKNEALPGDLRWKVEEQLRIIADITVYKKVHEILHELLEGEDGVSSIIRVENDPMRSLIWKLDGKNLQKFLDKLKESTQKLNHIYANDSEGVKHQLLIGSRATQVETLYDELKKRVPVCSRIALGQVKADMVACPEICDGNHINRASLDDDLLNLVNEVRSLAQRIMNQFDQEIHLNAVRLSLSDIGDYLRGNFDPAANGLADWDVSIRTHIANHTLLQDMVDSFDPVDGHYQDFLTNLKKHRKFIQPKLERVLIIVPIDIAEKIKEAISKMDTAVNKKNGSGAYTEFRFIVNSIMRRFLLQDRELYTKLEELKTIGTGLELLLGYWSPKPQRN